MGKALNSADVELLLERQKHYENWMKEHGSDLLEPTSKEMWALHEEYMRFPNRP